MKSFTSVARIRTSIPRSIAIIASEYGSSPVAHAADQICVVRPPVARDRSPDAVGAVIGALFDITKHEMQRELTLGTLDPAALEDDAAFALLGLSLRPDQHAAFVRRLHEVVGEFTEMDTGNELDPDAHRVRLLVAGFPITD